MAAATVEMQPLPTVENEKTMNPRIRYTNEERRQYREASLLLALWSILIMNEGVIRFIQHGQPGAQGLFEGTPIRFWSAFLGGLFEVIFGLFGLGIGLAGGILDYFSRPLTIALLIVQTILGWFVFIDYVIIIPSFRIANETTNLLTLGTAATKAFGALGILTSMNWCLALQGGQFVFICRMLAYGDDGDFLYQRSGSKMRAIFWNGNYLFAGIWSTASAIILIANRVGAVTSGVFFAPPNVGRIPIYLFITGLLIIVWALFGIIISSTNNILILPKYTLGSFFVFIFVWAHFTIGQLGFIAGNPAPSAVPAAGAAMHNHLAMMLAFLPVYFMWKHAHEATANANDR